MKKKCFAILLAVILIGGVFAACGGPADDDIHIALIAKDPQHEFWQTVYAGAQAAADYFQVNLTFEGPENGADISAQADMFGYRLAMNPSAIAVAALSPGAMLPQLQEAYDRGIPVVGFYAAASDFPAGLIQATASTDNRVAGGVAADGMFPAIRAAATAATPGNPVRIVILTQDDANVSLTDRTQGFAERMFEWASSVNDNVAITGDIAEIHFGSPNAAVSINVVISETPDLPGMITAAGGILHTPGLIGVFCTNEDAVNALLAAINAGASVPEGVALVGFDAGRAQKEAVRTGLMLGSVTQDPFHMGYQAVSLAVLAFLGESVSDIDTGAKWWSAGNMDAPAIAALLYD